MSGHSHWATIKRSKSANDAKKSRIFSKLSKLIAVAARQGGGDPDMNPSLRLAIEKAKAAAMPKDGIDRAIKKGTGNLGDEASFEEVVYEGFGPSGVAFMVRALTDNRNRTVAEIRNIFSRYDGSLGAQGSTAYIFSSNPEAPTFYVELSASELDKLNDLVEELKDHDDVQEVYTNAKNL